MYKHFFKRIIDIMVAFIGFTLLSPIFLLITIILFLTNRGNPFFIQKRPGKSERIFKVIKFKTMTDTRDADGNLLPDEKRLTKIGRFIRKTSLDEIPQLLNVLKGDMSLIGPRPLSIKYLEFYNEKQKRRHEVLPGITGLAQVNGRNALDWETRFEYDIKYVDNISAKLDFEILLLTIKKVIKREDVIEGGASSIKSFDGK